MVRLQRLAFIGAVMTVVVLPSLMASCKNNDISDSNNAAGVIGPAGGELKGPNGLTVLFPAGAVPSPTQFTLTAIQSYPTLMGQTLESPAVFSLEPHGFLFSGAVTVSLPVNPGVTSGTVLHSSCDMSNVCQMWDDVNGATFQNGAAIFTTPTFSLYAVVSGGNNADAGTTPDAGGGCIPSNVSASACFPMSNITCSGIGTDSCSCITMQGPACQGSGSGNAPCEFTWTCDGSSTHESCLWNEIGEDAGGSGDGGPNSMCSTVCATESSATAEMASVTQGGCANYTAP